nr:MAG TPA: hypothetical protein [Caudoviricetes sp.]
MLKRNFTHRLLDKIKQVRNLITSSPQARKRWVTPSPITSLVCSDDTAAGGGKEECLHG